MRHGSGTLHQLATTTAVHVSDLDHHVRAVRARNADLRSRITTLRAQVVQAAKQRDRQLELQRALGARILAFQHELEQAHSAAEDHLAAIAAAADEEVGDIVDSGRAQAAQLRRAIDALVGDAEPAKVVVLTPRQVGRPVDEDASTPARSAAM